MNIKGAKVTSPIPLSIGVNYILQTIFNSIVFYFFNLNLHFVETTRRRFLLTCFLFSTVEFWLRYFIRRFGIIYFVFSGLLNVLISTVAYVSSGFFLYTFFDMQFGEPKLVVGAFVLFLILRKLMFSILTKMYNHTLTK